MTEHHMGELIHLKRSRKKTVPVRANNVYSNKAALFTILRIISVIGYIMQLL